MTRRARAARERDMTRIHAVMVCVIMLILVQFLLLMVAVDGYMANHPEILIPSALASGVCFFAACWLIRYLVVHEAVKER